MKAVIVAVSCVIVFMMYNVMQQEKKNEFDIYKPGGANIKYVFNKHAYYAKVPMQFVGDLVQIHGYSDPLYIDYVKKFKNANLKPVLNKDGKALMAIWLSKFDANKTTLGQYHEAAYVYWVTKDRKEQLILGDDNVVEYLRHISLNKLEHKGIFQFVDKLYLSENKPIAVGREWGYDKYKSNEMKFEYFVNDINTFKKYSTFHMKHEQSSFDITININNYLSQDLWVLKDLTQSLGITKVLNVLLNEGQWYHVYAITKPNISPNRPKDFVPMVEIPMKNTKQIIRKVSEKDRFRFHGELKDRKFEPIAYLYCPVEFVLMAPYNA